MRDSPPLELGATLWRTLPGRVVLSTSAILAVLLAAGQLLDLPLAFDVIRRVAWISWLVGSAWLLVVAVSRNRQAFLWRVRRKLLLSYVFFGVVPVVLIVAFVLAAGVLLYVTVAAYVFRDSYGDVTRTMREIAETSAIEIGRTPTLAASGLERRYENLRDRYPGLSLALVPMVPAEGRGAPVLLTAGDWAHTPPPSVVPGWAQTRTAFAGTLVVAQPGQPAQLIVRAAVPTVDRTRMAIVDLPVNAAFVDAQQRITGVTMGAFSASGCGTDVVAPPAVTNGWALFRETAAAFDCLNWDNGAPGRVTIAIGAPVGQLYARLAALTTLQSGAAPTDWASVLLQLLWVLGVLFLIIQGSAVVMGALLAKSITSAVHELFEGTERVRLGDFAHRIRIESRDQLGELAGSFNRMSESIERLLVVQREKQRLDDELRIARQIQKSLLPVQPPRMAGLDVADLCEPAREVGGDYYDFFELGPHQLGVMIADVSGKGTSAALYMAELKGIMLALSRSDRSPRAVLSRVNRLLAEHLDNRSFITMTYVVVDLEARTLTMARAGHTPMLHASGDQVDVIAPSGMVLGLRLPGAALMFDRVLEERTVPLAAGDVVVLYTDGVTEASDAAGELFGDEGLARVVASQAALGAAGIRERVLRDVQAFVGTAEPHDDMTMVILKVADEADGGR